MPFGDILRPGQACPGLKHDISQVPVQKVRARNRLRLTSRTTVVYCPCVHTTVTGAAQEQQSTNSMFTECHLHKTVNSQKTQKLQKLDVAFPLISLQAPPTPECAGRQQIVLDAGNVRRRAVQASGADRLSKRARGWQGVLGAGRSTLDGSWFLHGRWAAVSGADSRGVCW